MCFVAEEMTDKSVCSRDEHFILPFPIWETLITLSISFLCWGELGCLEGIGNDVVPGDKEMLLDFPSCCSWGQLPSANVVWPWQGLGKQRMEVTTFFPMLETFTSEHIPGKFILSTGVLNLKKSRWCSPGLVHTSLSWEEGLPSLESREWSCSQILGCNNDKRHKESGVSKPESLNWDLT